MNNAGINTHVQLVDMSVDNLGRNDRGEPAQRLPRHPRRAARHDQRRWGRIISTSSQLAHKGGRQLTHYAAAKAGVLGFTRSLAYEVAPYNITVNAICPGPINTDMSKVGSAEWKAQKLQELPLGRYGDVDEVAPTLVLIASDEGSYYTGASFNMNGGDVMI